jgi:flagellar protein FliO/FliZ
MIDMWDSLLRTLSALAVVLALMGLLTFAARRVLGHRASLGGQRPLIHVVASGYVAPRRSIALVSVAGEYLIVGLTATDLVALGRLGDQSKVQELIASSVAAPPAAPAEPPSFLNLSAWLRHLPVGARTHETGRQSED